MMQMVSALETTNATELLTLLCNHRNHTIRWKAIQLLARHDRQATITELQRAVNDSHQEIRFAASATLAAMATT